MKNKCDECGGYMDKYMCPNCHEGVEQYPKGEIYEQGYQYCKNCDVTTLHRPKMDAVKNGQRVCNKCDCCNYY